MEMEAPSDGLLLTAINTCLDEVEEFKGRAVAISQLFFLLVIELLKEFWPHNSYIESNIVHFHAPISFLKLSVL